MLQAGKMDMVIDIPDSMAPLQQVDDRQRLLVDASIKIR